MAVVSSADVSKAFSARRAKLLSPGREPWVSLNGDQAPEARREVSPARKRKKPEQSTLIQVHGPNARANINSVDNSVNSITVTEQNVFSETRNAIKAEVPEAEQAQILERLAALENSVHKPTGMQKYKEFAAVAVEYGRLLPLLPKLLEMAKQVVHGL